MRTSEIVEIVEYAPRLSGCDATFVRLNDKVGVKYFESSSERDYNYNLQKKFEKYNLAPKTGQKVSFRFHGKQVYGFLTDIVVPCDEAIFHYAGIDIPNIRRNSYYFDVLRDNEDSFFLYYSNWNEAYDKLRNKLENVPFKYTDLHPGNWGMYNGEPVLIDFSRGVW